MTIIFVPLDESHFPLLLKWLNTSHVKKWWGEILWTSQLINEKYKSYIKGYKIEKGLKKRIQSYIICFNNRPCGYIQIYNAYDFERSYSLDNLPSQLAALDMYIGEENYLKQGIGTQALKIFIQTHCDPFYDYALVDPDRKNHAAVRCYTKAGFKEISIKLGVEEIVMLKKIYP